MTRHGTFGNDEWSCVDAMAAGELSRLGIAEAADRLRCGELTAVDYASALLERQHLGRRRMRMRSSGSNQTVRLKRPMRRMREESGGRALALLHGVPLAFKDNIDIQGTCIQRPANRLCRFGHR